MGFLLMNDSIEGYQGIPPDATSSATSTQISNSTIKGYAGTQEDTFTPCAQIPRVHSVAAPSINPSPPQQHPPTCQSTQPFTQGYFLAYSLFGEQGKKPGRLVQEFDQIANGTLPYMDN
ncbi:hypothetical protein BDV93DRAFT_508747 [Ceratobasidium sp. AG-I]|nr:hypothetical protein BDV93DRAFT_508747 [Ceratobasidium sp. AG-I]